MAQPAQTTRTPAYSVFDLSTDKLSQLLTITTIAVNGFSADLDRATQALAVRLSEGYDDLKSSTANTDSTRTDVVRAEALRTRIQELLTIATDLKDARQARAKQLRGGLAALLESLPVLLVTAVEAYLKDVFAYACNADPTLMEKAKQSVEYADVLRADSLNDLKQKMVARRARAFVDSGGPRTWIDKLTRMGARTYRPSVVDDMEGLWGVRNLLVHSAGIITSEFVQRYPNHGTPVGGRLAIDFDRVRSWIDAAYHFVEVTDAHFVERCHLA